MANVRSLDEYDAPVKKPAPPKTPNKRPAGGYNQSAGQRKADIEKKLREDGAL